MMGKYCLYKLICLLAVVFIGSPCAAYMQPIEGYNASAVTSAPLIKSPLSGFVSMGDVSFGPGGIPDNSLKWIEAEPGVFSGVVINITWAQLQPTPYTFDTSSIDQALQSVAAYNISHPDTPLGIRLNVIAGLAAPLWAKNLNGSPIEIAEYPNGTSPPIIFTIGRFWAPAYRADWKNLQDMLATRYDGNTLIHEVTNGSCATITGEPFAFITTPFALGNLHNAGFADQKYYDCLADSAADYAGWKESLVHYAFNPFLRTDTGLPISDEATTVALIKKWRASLGDRGVLANHDLQAGTGSPEFPRIKSMYLTFRRLGPLIDLQAWGSVEDWPSTIEYGIAAGATEIELWPGNATGEIQQAVPAARLEFWSAKLKANLSAAGQFSNCGQDTCPN